MDKVESKNKFNFKSKVTLYPGMGGWHFATIEKKIAEKIDRQFRMMRRGWNSLPVKARIGKSEWETSIFADKKSGGYLLAIKAAIRKKEKISEGSFVNVEIEIK